MSLRPDDMAANAEPLFNIGAVSRMTAISETTLRVWERRYDFPKSARTSGGHRLYSQQDVQRLQWVKLRIDEGMQTSQAIRALHYAERQGELVSPPVERGENVVSLALVRQKLLDHLLTHDAQQANQVIGDALALYSMEALIFEVIAPPFYDIGEAWSEGRINVATEHFASNCLRNHLLAWIRTSPPNYQVNPVVLACAPGELHEGSLLMLAVLLRRLRWPIIYLGQTMPLPDLGAFVAEVEVAAVVFVAMSEDAALALADWSHWLREAARTGQPFVGYGGRIFQERPELTEQIPGVFLGNTLQEGVTLLDRMLHDLNPLLR